MNRQRIVLITLGLIIALGSAYCMFTLTEEFEEKVEVIVAASDIKAYDEFGSSNVEIICMPGKYVLPNAVTSINTLKGRGAKGDIYQGEQIIQEKIGTIGLKPSENERLIFIPTTDVFMKRGQKVDIYLIYVSGKSDFNGVERLFSDKTVVSVISKSGYSIYDDKGISTGKEQSGIEIALTHEEILVYLERTQYSKVVIVRSGEGGK